MRPTRRRTIRFAATDWGLLEEIPHEHPAYRELLGEEPGTPASDMAADRKADVSPLTHVSHDDPPVLLVHGDADQIVPLRHALDLDARLEAAGTEVELFAVPGGGHDVAAAREEAAAARALVFLERHLLGKAAPPKTDIAIVVGPEKHKPGTHEVAAGGRLMAYCLEQAGNVENVNARVFHRWPEDASILDSADSVVFIGDQFPPERLSDSERAMRNLTAMMDRGCGIVCIHYATGLAAGDVAEDGDHPLLHWTGGYFAARCNHHRSVARIFDATIEPAVNEGHPIRRGWNVFSLRDEPYTQNWFGRDGLAEGGFPLATVEFPPDAPKREIVAWATERESGGRGAGITLPHFYRNWERAELRKLIFNTILWTAQREVPRGGVEAQLPALENFQPVAVDPLPRKQTKNAK